MHELLEIVEPIVRQAGRMAADAFSRRKQVRLKAGREPVTETDLAVERFIIDELSRRFPGDGFLGEEHGERDAGAGRVWIMDPIDGTRNFARSIPLYCVSLALRQAGEFVLGAVYCPEADQMYLAAAGCGATLNGAPMHVSQSSRLDEATLGAEIPGLNATDAVKADGVTRLSALMHHAERLRCVGAGALALAYCASGQFDAYVNFGHGSRVWDLAAGEVLVREAGGVYTTTQGGVIVAGPQSLCEQVLALEAFAE